MSSGTGLNPTSHDGVDGSIFWGEIAPSEHFVQIYADDSAFADTLADFALGGLCTGEAVVIIAREDSLAGLRSRLEKSGVDVEQAIAEDRFIALPAQDSLDRFMVDGWPDAGAFHRFVGSVLAIARGRGRRVRAFGEMVALLWERGHYAATIRLEQLWHKLYVDEDFSLYCAYPRVALNRGRAEAIAEICASHSRIFTPGKAPVFS